MEALLLLYVSKGILWLPFTRCLKMLRSAETLHHKADLVLLVQIRRAVARADRFACWKNRCLVRSFAGRFMLQRRKIGSVLYLGLQLKQGKELVAHAWLESGSIFITPRGDTSYKKIYKV